MPLVVGSLARFLKKLVMSPMSYLWIYWSFTLVHTVDLSVYPPICFIWHDAIISATSLFKSVFEFITTSAQEVIG